MSERATPSAPPGEESSIPRRLRNAPNTYVFDLSPIKARLGERWAVYGPSVHRIANRTIFRRLDGKGKSERYGDAYVLVFDRLKGRRAQQEGRRIYDQFVELLSKGQDGNNDELSQRGGRTAKSDNIGSQPGLLRRICRQIKGFFRRSSDSVASTTADDGLDDGQIEEQEGGDESASSPDNEAGSRTVSGPGGASSRSARNFAPGRHSSGGIRRTQSTSAQSRRFLPPPDGSVQNAASPAQDLSYLDNLKLMRESRALEDAIAREVLRREAKWSNEMANRDFPPADLSFIYRSMWNLRSKHLTTFTSVPICWKNSMEVYHGEDIVPPPRRPENLFELDVRIIQDTLEVLERLFKQKRTVLFMNVVHASTLARKDAFAQYLRLIKSIPQVARQQLIFDVVDVAAYAHSFEALQMVRHLRPYARAVTASVGLEDRNIAFWKECGFLAVGADMARDKRPEEEKISNMANFTSQAKRHGLFSYLRELDTLSLTLSAVGAGFDFLEGAVIGSGDDPERINLREFDMANLYEDEVEVVWAER